VRTAADDGLRNKASESMPLKIDRVRRDFPYLGQCLYLNTATAGLSWAGQGAAAARFYDFSKARGYDGHEDWRAELKRCQKLVAELLKVSPAEVSFVSTTSEALNLVARAVQLRPGDRIVVAEDEFPSVELAWNSARARGVDVVRVPVRAEPLRTQTLADAISDRTRIVAVSHVHWYTGTRVDLALLSEVCHKRGARLIVDGVQAVGAVDVQASVADLYTASVFKWLLSGFGLAFLVTRRSFSETLEPELRGHGNEPPSRDLPYGHANHPGIYALAATLDYLAMLGWTEIHQRVATLTTLLTECLRARGLRVVTPLDARAGIISLARRDARLCASKLAQRNVKVELRGDLIRVSPHFYNTEAEIEEFVEIIATECP